MDGGVRPFVLRLLRTTALVATGALVSLVTISLAGSGFGRGGTKIAVIVLICGAAAVRQRFLALGLAVLAVTPVAAWVMVQGLTPLGGSR